MRGHGGSTLLQRPTQWLKQKFWRGVSSHNNGQHKWCERAGPEKGNAKINVSGGIGAGADKFLGVRRIFSQISPNLSENFLPHELFLVCSPKNMKNYFWCGLQKRSLLCFSPNVGRHFFKSNNAGRHFCPDFQGF